MTGQTARLSLPLLEAGQAQKELFHNEALTLLDAAVQPAAESVGAAAPPAAPSPGQSWIVGTAPTGAWAGRAGALATWTVGGWRFVDPVEGMSVWIADAGLAARFVGGAWDVGRITANALVIGGRQVVGAAQPAVASPAGGTVIDDAARGAISGILAALRNHGLIAP